MAIFLERAQVSGRATGIPMFAMNPVTGCAIATRTPDKLVDGDQVHVLERDYRTSSTTFLRSSDGGRTWVWYQVHEILRTRKV